MDTFAEIVHGNFDDLATLYSMHCVGKSEFHVRYENEQVILGIGWDTRRSYELGVGIQLKASANDMLSFDLADILRYQGNDSTADEVEVLHVEAGQDLHLPIKKLAALTRIHGDRFLQGDAEAYASMAEFMGRRSAIYNAQLSEIGSGARSMYREADLAWTSQDYQKVVEIYRAMSFFLLPFARERLAIAEKRISERQAPNF
jgi:hypothetical protein